jgi:hypothetical protein
MKLPLLSEENEQRIEIDPLASLNEKVPVDQLLTPENAEDAKHMTGMGWVSIFRESPAKNAEAEVLIGRFVGEAVTKGRWVDIPLQGAADKLEEIGFVERVAGPKGEEMLRPTGTMVAFIQERLAPFGPKKQS